MPEGSENVNIGEPIAIIVWVVCWREHVGGEQGGHPQVRQRDQRVS